MKRFYDEAGGGGGAGASGGAAGSQGAGNAQGGAAGGSLLETGGSGQQGGAGGQGSGQQGGQVGGGTGGANGGAASGPWFSGWLKPDGKLDKAALDKLPDSLKGFKATLEQFSDLDGVISAFQHNKSLVGKKGLAPLREGASDVEKAEHRKILAQVNGVPEKPEGYGIKRPDNIPEDLWDQGYVDAMTQLFHEEAVSPAAVQRLVAKHNELIQAAVTKSESQDAEAHVASFTADNKKLDDAFGFQRAELSKMAERAARYFGVDPSSPGFNRNPDFIIAMAKVAQRIKEPEFVQGTAVEAPDPEVELKSLTSGTHKYSKALKDPRSPLYAEAQAHFDKLVDLKLKKSQRVSA